MSLYVVPGITTSLGGLLPETVGPGHPERVTRPTDRIRYASVYKASVTSRDTCICMMYMTPFKTRVFLLPSPSPLHAVTGELLLFLRVAQHNNITTTLCTYVVKTEDRVGGT